MHERLAAAVEVEHQEPTHWRLRADDEEVIGLYNDRQTVIDDGASRRVTLKKGPNVIRAAIVNGGGATDFCARVLDEAGNPVKEFTTRLAAAATGR